MLNEGHVTLPILCLSMLLVCAQTDIGLTASVEVDTIEDSHYVLRT